MTPFAARVLDVVDRIPAGRVMAYGDVAVAAGRPGAARAVGQVMARHGDEVPWHRVVRSDGSLPASHEREALARLAAEGVRRSADGRRVDMAVAAWWPESDGTAPVPPILS